MTVREVPALVFVRHVSQGWRAALQAGLFSLLDAGPGDGVLDASELRPFAELEGFESSDTEWVAQYESLCREYGRDPSVGINLEAFCKFIEASSDEECMDDKELVELLSRRQWKSPAFSPNLPLAEQLTQGWRAALVAGLFVVLDVFSADGSLDAKELRPFCEHLGFEGSDADWVAQYEILCKGQGREPSNGLSFAGFRHITEAPSIDDGDCLDEKDLQELLNTLHANASAVAAIRSGRHQGGGC